MTSLVTFHPLRVLDATLADRTEPFADWDDVPEIPVQPVDALEGMEWIEANAGIDIWLCKSGLYYDYETGFSWSLDHARHKTQVWRDEYERRRLEEGPCDPDGWAW